MIDDPQKETEAYIKSHGLRQLFEVRRCGRMGLSARIPRWGNSHAPGKRPRAYRHSTPVASGNITTVSNLSVHAGHDLPPDFLQAG